MWVSQANHDPSVSTHRCALTSRIPLASSVPRGMGRPNTGPHSASATSSNKSRLVPYCTHNLSNCTWPPSRGPRNKVLCKLQTRAHLSSVGLGEAAAAQTHPLCSTWLYTYTCTGPGSPSHRTPACTHTHPSFPGEVTLPFKVGLGLGRSRLKEQRWEEGRTGRLRGHPKCCGHEHECAGSAHMCAGDEHSHGGSMQGSPLRLKLPSTLSCVVSTAPEQLEAAAGSSGPNRPLWPPMGCSC